MTPTIHTFDIELSDVDRHVYETPALRVARHPPEAEDYLVTRVLAYCLEYADGISFSNGLAEPDEPPLAVRDLTGVMRVWIDIGAPNAARMHKAGKAAARVAVYTHKDPVTRQVPREDPRARRAMTENGCYVIYGHGHGHGPTVRPCVYQPVPVSRSPLAPSRASRPSSQAADGLLFSL